MAAKKSFRPKILRTNHAAGDVAGEAAAFYEDRRKWAEYAASKPDLSDRAFRVGYWLSRRMNGDDKCCWFSLKAIADRMGKSPRSVRYALSELRSQNLLVVVEEPGKPNCYFLHAPFM